MGSAALVAGSRRSRCGAAGRRRRPVTELPPLLPAARRPGPARGTCRARPRRCRVRPRLHLPARTAPGRARRTRRVPAARPVVGHPDARTRVGADRARPRDRPAPRPGPGVLGGSSPARSCRSAGARHGRLPGRRWGSSSAGGSATRTRTASRGVSSLRDANRRSTGSSPGMLVRVPARGRPSAPQVIAFPRRSRRSSAAVPGRRSHVVHRRST